VLLLLFQLREEAHQLSARMLLPGVRLVDGPGALHFFDGRRVVSFRGEDEGREALRSAALELGGAESEHAVPAVDRDRLRDARELLIRMKLAERNGGQQIPVAAGFASAATAGWVDGAVADKRLAETVVHVWDSPDGLLAGTLAASGLVTQALPDADAIRDLDPTRSAVAVAALDRQPVERLRAANAACLAATVAWLPVGAYDGAVLRVGPLMIPGQTACAGCLLRRLAANVAYADAFQDVVSAPAAPTPPALRTWAYSLAALNLIQWIAARPSDIPGRLLTLLPDQLSIRSSNVLRVPRCTECCSPDFVPAAAPWGVARDH
jgi:bacteriocin biosynthesis cyclodehydratase domain-containing protein